MAGSKRETRLSTQVTNMSRPPSPSASEQRAAPPANLWSSILDSVSSKRSLPSKQILLLGEPGSGRSTIASALLQKQNPDPQDTSTTHDFALGYDWADVRDEADEGIFQFGSCYIVVC
jgi:dynein light intermediate chain 1